MEPLSNVAALLASWWGYMEGEPTIVGILVAVIGALAVVYVVQRLRSSRGSSRRSDDRS